uniref:Uncharacterized protein n=1 Tax=Timema poppense TaxID=170557 RepID=A0A7R9DCR0_TIMPO|nr:unnamed protein product [Timema poppensis]
MAHTDSVECGVSSAFVFQTNETTLSEPECTKDGNKIIGHFPVPNFLQTLFARSNCLSRPDRFSNPDLPVISRPL